MCLKFGHFATYHLLSCTINEFLYVEGEGHWGTVLLCLFLA